MSLDPYEQLALFYDAIHSELVEDIPFVLNLAAEKQGRILEFGCGTGRLLLPLAEAGFEVVGLDLSGAMLAQARARIEHRALSVRLIEGSLSGLSEKENFELVLISYNTFLHILPFERLGVLRGICRHLTPQGQLFIDIPNPFEFAALPTETEWKYDRELEMNGSYAQQSSRFSADEEQQKVSVHWRFEQNGVITEVAHNYHYLYPHELVMVLENAGLFPRAIFGDYDKTPFDEEAARFLMLAEAID